MDKRKGSTHARSRGRVEGQSGHPGSSRRKGRPMTTGRGRNGRSGTRHAKKVNRARKRRNKILFVMIIILLIMILAAGAVFFKRYGSSNEEADKEHQTGQQEQITGDGLLPDKRTAHLRLALFGGCVCQEDRSLLNLKFTGEFQ